MTVADVDDPASSVDGHDVVATFCAAAEAHGFPAATLTDNGAIRPTHSTQNGIWVERIHQTVKRWLGQQPAVRALAELQAQLKASRRADDEERPHRAIGRGAPGEADRATPKALPAGPRAQGHLRLRYDLVDKTGAMTLRRAGRMHHLGIGAAHRGRRVLAIVHEQAVTVVALETGEVLPSHRIDPGRPYWRNRHRDPRRWPGSRATS